MTEAREETRQQGLAGDTEQLFAQTVEASCRLGSDPFLVLHGGGNTSAKNAEYLWAKASGFDLGSLTAEGLVELRRPDLEQLLAGDSLSDIAMMDGYAAATVLPNQPPPTIEALLHHALPFDSVLHTHADAIVAITDTVHGLDLVAELFGDEAVAVPYVMPGFDLAKIVPQLWRDSGSKARAIVLQHHGLFTMGDTVAEAYELHIDMVRRAEEYIAAKGRAIRAPFAEAVTEIDGADPESPAAALVAELRDRSSKPVVALRCDDEEVRVFIARPDLAELVHRGPTTLEHVIRTKRVPLIGDDVAGYIAAYREYFDRNRGDDESLVMLDPIPRVVLHPEIGLLAIGDTPKAATAVMDIYRHTIRVMEAAELMGGYRTVSEAQAFALEYWELEQRRLR